MLVAWISHANTLACQTRCSNFSNVKKIAIYFPGLQLYDGNPYVSGNTFEDFYDDEYKVAGGIGFRKPHAGEPPTVFMDNHFGYVDNTEGNFDSKGVPTILEQFIGVKLRLIKHMIFRI